MYAPGIVIVLFHISNPKLYTVLILCAQNVFENIRLSGADSYWVRISLPKCVFHS